MKRKIRRILYAIASTTFIFGLLAIAYPYLSDWINKQTTSKLYSDYLDMARSMDTTEVNRMLQIAEEYNVRLLGNSLRWMPSDEANTAYVDMLDTSGTGIMCYIEIPKINLRLPVYHGTEETTLQIAVGHMQGSSLPIGGKGTHAVLSGHNGLVSQSIFTELDRMEIGDTFTLTVFGYKLEYKVDEINIVLPGDFNYFNIDAYHDYVTLVTCTPFGVNSHRLLIRGERIDYTNEQNRLEVRF